MADQQIPVTVPTAVPPLDFENEAEGEAVPANGYTPQEQEAFAEAEHQRLRRMKNRRYTTTDFVKNLTLQEVVETIDEIKTRMDPSEAHALQLLLKKADELRAAENAKRDRDTDSEASSAIEEDNAARADSPILKIQPRSLGETTRDPVPSIRLSQTPQLTPFTGKKEEDWSKFKNQLIKIFRSLQIEDDQAADQFCTYIDGYAYKYWASLPTETQDSFRKTLSAFDHKYADGIQRGYWQMKFENMTYPGPDKESPDDLAVRIRDIVGKAYPDKITKKGTKSKYEERKMQARRKFWDLMPMDIREQIFIKYGSSDPPLRQQLEYARVLLAAKQRSRKEEQGYDMICAVQQQPQQQNWQPQQQNWQPKQQNWQPQQQNWQPQQQNWQPKQQQKQQNWQPKQNWQQKPRQQNWQQQGNTPQQQRQQKPQNPNVARYNPEIICNQCGKKGHIKRICWHNPANQQQNQQQNQGGQRQWTPNNGGQPRQNQGQGGRNQQQRNWKQNGGNGGNNQGPPKQGFLPSKSGHPEDMREKKAPMNAMPVQRVQQQQPYKPQVAACQDEQGEFDFMEGMEYGNNCPLNN